MKKFFIVLLVVCFVLAGALSVYAEEELTVGFIVGSREHVFYNLIEKSIMETCEELGIEPLVYDGELDANVQSNHIQNLISMEVRRGT